MSNVVGIGKKKRIKWFEGKARCLDCQHEWVAVFEWDPNEDDGEAKAANKSLMCPKCKLYYGRLLGMIHIEKPHWHCACGNDLFQVTTEVIYCPRCGRDQYLTGDK